MASRPCITWFWPPLWTPPNHSPSSPATVSPLLSMPRLFCIFASSLPGMPSLHSSPWGLSSDVSGAEKSFPYRMIPPRLFIGPLFILFISFMALTSLSVYCSLFVYWCIICSLSRLQFSWGQKPSPRIQHRAWHMAGTSSMLICWINE